MQDYSGSPNVFFASLIRMPRRSPFSTRLRKTKLVFRPSLDPDETLGSIIATKMVIEDKDISKLTFDLELLDLAKTATKSYNNQHKKK